ncbi:MAG: rubrerythrin family protein [Candidatus Aminicenantes bacterium]|nr:rubrerythrin family protein [Candidatus Aminicenantes bacterium]
MKKMTEENLENAFAGESQAHIKYLAFADKAEREKFSNIARLFRANSFAEQVHATNHLRALSGIGETKENVQAAIDGETFEVNEMYPAYIRVAEEQQEKVAETMNKWALEAEKVHAELYTKAKAALAKGEDLEFKPIQVCQVCGFTIEGEAPEKCPVCGSPKEKFTKF